LKEVELNEGETKQEVEADIKAKILELAVEFDERATQ
jgi:hypothetical protein